MDRRTYYKLLLGLKTKLLISKIKIKYLTILMHLAPVKAFLKTAQVTIFCICIAATKGSDAAIEYIDKENAHIKRESEELQAENEKLERQLEQYRKEILNGQSGSLR